MNGELRKQPVAATVIEVVVRVHHQQRLVGQLIGDRADVGHAKPGVHEHRGLRALDQEGVDVTWLADEVYARLELTHVEPRRAWKLAVPVSVFAAQPCQLPAAQPRGCEPSWQTAREAEPGDHPWRNQSAFIPAGAGTRATHGPLIPASAGTRPLKHGRCTQPGRNALWFVAAFCDSINRRAVLERKRNRGHRSKTSQPGCSAGAERRFGACAGYGYCGSDSRACTCVL